MRLLLVEDEPSLRESVARKLHRAGYETDDCGDGETALEMLAAERYDLVLLDLNLPRRDGSSSTSSKRIINAPYINCVSVYYHYNSFC